MSGIAQQRLRAAAVSAEEYQRHIDAGENFCRKCRLWKKRREFHLCRRNLEGVQYYCRQCVCKRPARLKAPPAKSLDDHINALFRLIFNANQERREKALAKWRKTKRCDNPVIEVAIRQSIAEFHLKGKHDATEDD